MKGGAFLQDFLTNIENYERLYSLEKKNNRERMKSHGIKIQKDGSNKKLEKQAQQGQPEEKSATY